MKAIWKSTRQFFVLSSVALIASFALISCEKEVDDDDNDKTYVVSGSSNGSQVVPSVSVSATGNITGTFDARTNILNYNMTWTGLTGAATSAGFYTGSSGANGSLVQNTTITTSGSTGASMGTMTLSDAQESALLNGTWYYVIGTTANASGEIRGQMSTSVQ